MKTKIGLPFGLALVVFLGVFTTMLALGLLSPERARCRGSDSQAHIERIGCGRNAANGNDRIHQR